MVGSLLRAFAVLAALPVLTGGALAQTTGKATTETKQLLENERMKVMEVVFRPGEQAGGGGRANRFVYALTDGSLVFSPPGKTPYELSFSAGEALWLPSDAIAMINDNEKPVRALVVEFKDGTRGAAPVAKGKGKAKLKLQIRGKGAPAAKPGKTKTATR